MSAVIIVIPKNVPQNQLDNFLQPIDSFIESQKMKIIDNHPRIYLALDSIPPNKIKNLVNTIKNSDNYSKNIMNIYYSSNLSRE